MKRFFTFSLLFLLAVGFSASLSGAEKVYFKEIRARAAKVKKLSREDFALGNELMKEIRKLAALKKPAVPAPIISFETLSSAGRMWFTDHNYTDRQLFCSRDKWTSFPSQFQRESHKKTFEIFDMYGIRTFNTYSYGEHAQRYLESLKALDSKLEIIPTVTPAGYSGKLNARNLKLFAQYPHTKRFNGKILFLCWSWLKTVKETKAFIKELERLTASPVAYVHSCGTIQQLEDPWVFWRRGNGVPATTILYWFDHLTGILEYAEGIEFANRLTTPSGNLDTRYYYEIIMPLFAAICAQERFNGKKLCGLEILTGYNNYRGTQRLSANGTKTLRDYLAICDHFKLDILKAFEWDEYNEDSHFQPTINKPMAYQRILKYWNDRNNKRPFTPNKGDDLSLPNLIVSHVKHQVAGHDYELELLHVPDSGRKGSYTVKVDVLNENGKLLKSSGNIQFSHDQLKDYTLRIPGKKYITSAALITRLTIDYLGKKRIIEEGLPATVVRPSTLCDTTWYSTPIRNLMFPVKNKTVFGKVTKPAGALPERITLSAASELEFKEDLNSVEIVQNGRDTRFSFDPKNEYFQNDKERMNLILTFYRLEIGPGSNFDVDIEMKNVPSAVWFQHPKEKKYKYLTNINTKALPKSFVRYSAKKVSASSWRNARILSIKKSEFAKGVFSLKGTFVSGPCKGQKFSWELPLAKLRKAGVSNKILENGLQLALEIPQRLDRLPLPINGKKAKFATTIHTGYPYGVFAIRAVSNSGKIFWSKPAVRKLAQTGKKGVVTVFHNQKGPYELTLDSSRIPHIQYRFDPAIAGNILTTSAGREFYANAGGYDLVPTGYEGYHCSVYSIPASFRLNPGKTLINPRSRGKQEAGRKFVPKYEKLPDGSYCLNFTGKGEFIGFPPSLFPQRTGYTVKFEFLPLDLEDDQVYFVHSQHVIAGFRLRTEDYRLVIDFYRRQAPKANSESIKTFKTNLDPVEGKWNRIEFKYDLRKVSVTLNGKTQSFPCQGLSRFFAVGGFGGDGTRSKNGNKHYFKGKLKSFEVIHSAK